MASRMDLPRELFFFKKKLTVSGIIGHTQGVNRASRPPRNPQINMLHSDDPDVSSGPEITGVHHGCDDGSNEVAAVETTAGVAASSPNEKSNELGGRQFWSLQAI